MANRAASSWSFMRNPQYVGSDDQLYPLIPRRRGPPQTRFSPRNLVT
ncbi:hypothetical protein I549_4256 [Mycobacterium avium subsp. avium 2285 (R)]|nr:hypothetical protein I549_4256 [Mycobacterium avium subsp. avium 2285 (R)]